MITVQGISKFLGKKDLFRDVSFTVRPGERIGLIGSNGTGKTTLFSILMGETEADTGAVLKSRNLRIGWLPQQAIPLPARTILAHAMDIHHEIPAIEAEIHALQRMLEDSRDGDQAREASLRLAHLIECLEHMGGYDLEARAHKILAGLGFRSNRLDLPVSTLSGGWAMRLELARLLLAEPDFLLLDEPTNHLDLQSLLWLEQYLLGTPSAMMIVSHDRAFLNKVVSRILELDQARLHEYTGNYDDYLREKVQRQEILLASYRNQQERIKQMERFVERNRYRKDRARQAQSRIKQMEKIERIEAPEDQATVHFTFPAPPRSGKRVLELIDVHKTYGDNTVYDGLNLVVERGDRIAFIGPNGSGKSTLLKILAGTETPSRGERVVGSQTRIGYYAQHQWEQLHMEWTVLEEASSIAGDVAQTHLRGLLGAFLFRNEDVSKRICVLSGGEKARLTFCKLLLQKPNFLLLDEPTNHLDIPSRDVLETSLEEFEETICFISHDRHFINRIANKILVVEKGRAHLLPGNFDDYQGMWKQRIDEAGSDELAREGPVEPKRDSSNGRRTQTHKRFEAEKRNELYRLKKPIQDRLDRVEASLNTAHDQLNRLNERLGDPTTYQDGGHVQELQRQYQECQAKIEALTREWEEDALAMEALEVDFWKNADTACR